MSLKNKDTYAAHSSGGSKAANIMSGELLRDSNGDSNQHRMSTLNYRNHNDHRDSELLIRPTYVSSNKNSAVRPISSNHDFNAYADNRHNQSHLDARLDDSISQNNQSMGEHESFIYRNNMQLGGGQFRETARRSLLLQPVGGNLRNTNQSQITVGPDDLKSPTTAQRRSQSSDQVSAVDASETQLLRTSEFIPKASADK